MMYLIDVYHHQNCKRDTALQMYVLALGEVADPREPGWV